MRRGSLKARPRSQTRLVQDEVSASQRGANARAGSLRMGRGLGVTLLLLSALMMGLFLWDARFRVATVHVRGATLVSEELIVAEAALQGQPIFLLRTRDVQAQVSAAFGCFERVRVQARLPDRVTISVTEKQAMLVWENQGAYWWLDGEGRVLGHAVGHGELPVLHDRSDLPVTDGATIAGVPWDFLHEMIGALPAVRDFEYTLEDGLIVFVTTERWPVYLGSSGNTQAKVTVLKELSALLLDGQEQVVFIDLKDERRPAVKVVSG
jgi:cell division septal protein FtsQ